MKVASILMARSMMFPLSGAEATEDLKILGYHKFTVSIDASLDSEMAISSNLISGKGETVTKSISGLTQILIFVRPSPFMANKIEVVISSGNEVSYDLFSDLDLNEVRGEELKKYAFSSIFIFPTAVKDGRRNYLLTRKGDRDVDEVIERGIYFEFRRPLHESAPQRERSADGGVVAP